MSLRHVGLALFLSGCGVAPFHIEQRAPGELTLADDEESALLIAGHDNPCVEPAVHIDGEAATANVLTEQRAFTVSLTPEDATLTILRKKRSKHAARRVDLNLFIASSTGFDRDAAQHNKTLQAILDDADTVLAQADISIGDVRYYYLSAVTDAIAYFDCGPDGSLTPTTAKRVWSGDPARAPDGVNVLLVDAIDVVTNAPFEQYQVAGFSPVPGAGIHTRAVHDGVVLTLPDFDLDPSWGVHLAHELGHYFGLFHVVEKDGTTVDTIGDTPKHDPAALGNLMHWSGEGFALTPGQIARMRLHPLVY